MSRLAKETKEITRKTLIDSVFISIVKSKADNAKDVDKSFKQWFHDALDHHVTHCLLLYKGALQRGLPEECAKAFLPPVFTYRFKSSSFPVKEQQE